MAIDDVALLRLGMRLATSILSSFLSSGFLSLSSDILAAPKRLARFPVLEFGWEVFFGDLTSCSCKGGDA